jgi:hypothetical protein
VPYAEGGLTCELNGRLRCGFHNRQGTTIPEHKARSKRRTKHERSGPKTTQVFGDTTGDGAAKAEPHTASE